MRSGLVPHRVIPQADATLPTTCVTLLVRLRQYPSDQAGWDEFVERYGRHIYRWCRIRKAMRQEPTIDWLLENQDKVQHYFHELGKKGEL